MARKLLKKYSKMINLRVMRIKQGLTLIELAKKAKVNYNTISQYENGIHKPQQDKLKQIANALECDVEDIR